MPNLQNDPVYRNAERRKNERRMRQEKRKGYVELAANIKILALWLLYVIVFFLFIGMVESAIPHRILLKWFIIFTFFGLSVTAVHDMERKIKKSPRNGNSERDTDK